MTTITAREEEQHILEKVLDSRRPEFIALYGRRRVGKTHLIRSFFSENSQCIFFDVAGSKDAPMLEQIANFVTRIGEVFYGGLRLAEEKNWHGAFKLLTDVISKQDKNKKIILFFDEFPWMATKNSRLLQNLDYYWNQYWSKNSHIKLIICGSAASWIIDKIVNNKAGLHNRITRHIHLKPFNLEQTERFLKSYDIHLNHKQILQVYMVTGGIPYYLLHIERGQSAAQIVDQLAFKQKALLINEFDNLFSSLFEKHEIFVDIIRLIAKYPYGINQEDIYDNIDKKFKGKRGIDILKSLEDTGFITSFKPYFGKRKGIFYRVIDEYTLFYLKWIEPVKDALMKQSFEKGYWQLQQNLSSWKSWSGYAFEAVCHKHVLQIKKSLHLLPIDIPATWRYASKPLSQDKGAQIDLLFDRQDDAITLCEIKYTDAPYQIDKAYAENLERKMEIFKEKTKTLKQIFMVMIAANGVKNNNYSTKLLSGIVTLEDLFARIEV